ncbi:MAG: hypothetical protein ABI881_06360 [Betaproteobacteria bacterium]
MEKPGRQSGDEASNRSHPGACVDQQGFPCEWRCINFLCERDGVEGARDYCRRTSSTYRNAVLMSRKRGHAHPHFASLPEYRRAFIASYLDFKRFAMGRGGMPLSAPQSSQRRH